MPGYTVIYMDTKGPRVLGEFDDKGNCRRAWKHYSAGAAIVGGNDGAVLECKTGTSDSVKRQLEAYAAHLKRQGPAAAEPPPEPTRAKVKVARVELEVEQEADEPAEAPEAATCAAKGCGHAPGIVRSNVRPAWRPFCGVHRVTIRNRSRSVEGGESAVIAHLIAGTLPPASERHAVLGARGGKASRAKAAPKRRSATRKAAPKKAAARRAPKRAPRPARTLAAGLERVKRHAAIVEALGGADQAEQLAAVVRDAGGVEVVVEALTEIRSVA